jgi:LmbE family N-acetylglucosaminyl deacetylase
MRRAELAASCHTLNVSDLVLLDYHDSGMVGWSTNDAPGSFWSLPVSDGASRLADLMREYRPDVVVTYDDYGFYGHPDHIQANRITMAAVEMLGDEAPSKVYWWTYPQDLMKEFSKRMSENGADWEEDPDAPVIGAPEEAVTAFVDVRDFAEKKLRALGAHLSQPDNANFLKFDFETFREFLGIEHFIRVRGTGADREDDLFDGLR